MAGKHITKKSERERFKREVVKLTVEHGGIPTNEERGEYRMRTKAGPLSIHICLNDHGIRQTSPCTVFTRFDHALHGQPFGGSVPSGKCNFHFSPGVTCDDALAEVRNYYERIKPTSLDEFMDTTALVPRAIVETVLQERGIVPHTSPFFRTTGQQRMADPLYMHSNPDEKDFDAAVEWFTVHCEERFILLWDLNSCSDKLASASGRDIAYVFVNHWLDAYLDNPPKYRKSHPNWQTPYNYEPMVA